MTISRNSDRCCCMSRTYDTTLLGLFGLDSQDSLSMSSGPLTGLPYMSSKEKKPVEAWETSQYANKREGRSLSQFSLPCLPSSSISS